jgi:hypothetical protein
MPGKAGAERTIVREIRSASDPAFRAAYSILRAAFPKAEMSPLRDWINALREREHDLPLDFQWHLLVAQRGSTVVAAASGTYLGNVNVGVIGYVAVRPDARVRGLGPRIRRALRRAFDRDAMQISGGPLEAIVGEVQATNRWLHTLVNREGAIALDFDYVQPSLQRDLRAVPLVFYYQPLRKPMRSLPTPYLRRLLYTIWRRAYRVARPLSRPEFRRMLRSLEGRARIGARPVG